MYVFCQDPIYDSWVVFSLILTVMSMNLANNFTENDGKIPTTGDEKCPPQFLKKHVP